MLLQGYRSTPVGHFENIGNLPSTLHRTSHESWWNYVPNSKNGMRFIRQNQEIIEPREFLTDLSTIPRVLQIGRLLKPDGLPAVALIHDWIVRLNNCGEGTHSFEDGIRIQQEALKTWMQEHPRDRSVIVFHLSRVALKSKRSKHLWGVKFKNCPPTLDELLAARR